MASPAGVAAVAGYAKTVALPLRSWSSPGCG